MSKKHKDEAKTPLETDLTPEQASDQQKPDPSSQPEGRAEEGQANTCDEVTPDQTETADAAEAEGSENEKALADALALVQDLEDKNLRLTAEFDNFRKRSRKEKEETYSIAKLDLVRDFLPLLDALDRAQASYSKLEGENAKQLREGMDLLVRQGQDCLAKLGVEEIPTQDAQFDPNLHEAVQHLEDSQYGENVVIDCLLKGYQADDKVIRHSVVRVAN